MNKKNPTIGELQVFSGILLWIAGGLFVVYKIINSIIKKNFLSELKGIIFYMIFIALFGALFYFLGKWRMGKSKEDKE